MRQLRIAVVGSGVRAQDHLETLAQLPEHYQLVAISDVQRRRAADAAERRGIPAYTNPLKMLDESRPDVLFVIIPPDGHHPITVAAAQRGVHVLCETPISITLSLADLMIDACQRAGVVLEVCENLPRMPRERLKQEIVRSGLIGAVNLVRLQYCTGSYHGIGGVRKVLPGQALRVWGFRRMMPAAPQKEFNGLIQDTQDWESAYFAFGDHSRGQEIATLLYEQPPRPGERNSWEIVGTRGRITDDHVHLREDTADGGWREVTYPISYVTQRRLVTPWGIPATVTETLVRAVVSTNPPVVWENPDAALGLPFDEDKAARANQLLTFHRAVTEGSPPEYGAAEARTDIELLLALRESARKGSVPVDLPLREPTSHEQALHDEYRLTYGRDPFAPLQETATAFYPRGGISHGVTHERIAEISPTSD
jgi:predicted dehydrogenase